MTEPSPPPSAPVPLAGSPVPPWLRAWEDADPAPTSHRLPASPFHAREGLQPGAIGAWWKAGLRAAFLRHPGELTGLQATPLVALVLALANVMALVAWQRLALPGPAEFNGRPLAWGGLDLLVVVWLCSWVRPQVGALRLVCLVLGLQFMLQSLTGPLWVAMAHGDVWGRLGRAGPAVGWALWVGPMAWWSAAVALLLWRHGDRHPRPLALACLLLAGLQVLHVVAPLPPLWAQAEPDAGEDERAVLRLTEPVLQAQATLLERQLAQLKPQRPGVADVYVLTFAPYGDEDVFHRESAMVAEVMARRFEADGRALQLVNHPATAEQLPWATVGNLRRALQRLAQVMNPREDVLFIHLTSHGAREGRLAAELWPLEVDTLTPAALRQALDQAGVQHRIISISACYSGSWIPALAGDNALVMTAADASHTSYGCGRLSALTFFGRAMYDELLRTATRSFTEAHARAREVIRQREQAAGKDDGYSNPQIRLGARIAPVLDALQRRLDAPAALPPARVTPATAAR